MDEHAFSQLQLLLDQAPCGIALYAMGEMQSHYLNAMYFRLIGYSKEEYQSMEQDPMVLIYEEDKPLLQQAIPVFRKTGKLSDEYRIVDKLGHLIWIKLDARMILIDGERFVFASFVNISREKQFSYQFSLLAENVKSSISILRVEGTHATMEYANDDFTRLFGYTVEQFNQDPSTYGHAISSESFSKFRQLITLSIKNGEAEEYEYALRTASGEERWIRRRFTATPLPDGDGYRLFSMATDITKEHQAEQEREEEQERFQQVLNATQAAIFEWNMKTGAFYHSGNYEQFAMSRIDPDDILHNKGPLDIVHPDDLPQLYEFFKASQRDKQADVTLRIKLVDGSYRWCRMIGLYLKDEQGNPLRTIGTILDINEEREKSLLADRLMHAMPGGLVIYTVKNGECSCQYFSDGFAKLTHQSREEVEARLSGHDALFGLMVPEDRERIESQLKDKIKKQEPLLATFRYGSKDGVTCWLHMNANFMRKEQGASIYYAVFTYPEQEVAMYQEIINDSNNSVVVTEAKDRRVLYYNNTLLRMFPLMKGRNILRTDLHQLSVDESLLLSKEEYDSLELTVYHEYRRLLPDGRYLCYRARRLHWLGHDACIFYITDETQEYQQQQQLHTLLDTIPNGIGIYEVKGDKITMRYLNDGYYAMLKTTRQKRREMMQYSVNVLDAVHPDDTESLLEAMRASVKTREDIDHTLRILNGKGVYIWVRITGRVASTESDGTTAIYVCYADVNAITLRQMELQQKYDDQIGWNRFLSQNALASCLVNLTHNTLALQSDDGTRGVSFKENETADAYFSALKACIPFEEDRNHYAKTISRDAMLASYHRGVFHGSVRYHFHNASTWLESFYDVTQNPVTGDIEAYCVTRDISEERRSEDVVQTLIDSEYDSIYTIDAKTGHARILAGGKLDLMTLWNEKNPEAMLADYFTKRCVDVDLERVLHDCNLIAIKAALSQSSVYSFSYAIKGKDGKILHKRASYSYLNSDHTTIVATIQDVTVDLEAELQQRQLLHQALDEAEKASHAKTDFLSTMSHDMRTPMNAIINLTKLAEEDVDNKEQLLDDLKKIDTSNTFLLALINDILDMSRIKSGKFDIQPVVYRYQKFKDSIMSVIIPLCEDRQIHIVLDMGDTDIALYVDSVRFNQLFFNLLSNAIKYSAKGSTIFFRTENNTSSEGKLHVDFIVEDHGIGMSQEFQSRLFKPFERENQGDARMGSGLGLAITKSIIDRMGGTIKVKSEQGKGSTFTVHLDLDIATESQIAEAEKAQTVEQLDTTKLVGIHALVVDDHPLNREIIERILKKKGIVVTTAKDGEEALDTFAQSPEGYYRVILMDVRMPVMDGLVASRSIRSLKRSDAEMVPIIAMTAEAFSENRLETKAAGMDEHLSKPIEPKKLFEMLLKYV